MNATDRYNKIFNIYKDFLPDDLQPGLAELSEPIVKSVLRAVAISQSMLEAELRQQLKQAPVKDNNKENKQ